MKVLIISHTAFSATESMGKTLSSYFSRFKPNELAQFYIHSQIPTSNACSQYYRITDAEALMSIIGRPCGQAFGCDRIGLSSELRDGRTDHGVTGVMYQKGRKRSPGIYLVRNIWWKLSHWNNRGLQKWLDEVNPDCVFFASGDYAFMYEIALSIAQSRRIPLFVSCMDDYYLYNKNENCFLGRLQHKLFMKTVNRTMSYATKLFCICDKMSFDYSELFHKDCITVYTPSTISQPLSFKKQKKISYLGNLGYQRNLQLIVIGKALKSLNLQPNHIDVYSTENRPEILRNMTEENGIFFHGAVGANDVLRIMGESMAVIHTESFDEGIKKSVRYSVSTKIADSLASGTCIFAYGPREVASIDYLIKENAAVCCTNENELKKTLEKLVNDSELREKTERNAVAVAKNKHSANNTPLKIKTEVSAFCPGFK